MKSILVNYPFLEEEYFKPVWLTVNDGKIESIQRASIEDYEGKVLPYILPGLIDAHIHIESSMLIPSRFAEIAVRHGTVATVSDPHEIANVLGLDGVRYMQENAKQVPLKIFFTAPSCVPATDFESAGSRLDSSEIGMLINDPDIVALGEMMNYPGVIYQNDEVINKINIALKAGKPVDGHAPGLEGDDLTSYISAGISTDHEAVDILEAREKIKKGLKILIREGSAAKNFDVLMPLIKESTNNVMLCSDDLHPDDLLVGHINNLVKRGMDKGVTIWEMIRVTSTNPIEHYGLNVGQLKVGDSADFILVDSPLEYNILSTWIEGVPVFEKGQISFVSTENKGPNTFIDDKFTPEDFAMEGESGNYRVIEAHDGSLITTQSAQALSSKDGVVSGSVENDVLKIAVVNRYKQCKPAVSWIRNFGLNSGAIASSVAHDSHNIIAVGCSDDEICSVVNALIEAKGGITLSNEGSLKILSLPIGGIMTSAHASDVANDYRELTILAKELGSELSAPFMTLSFMALLVIPEIKLGDKGLFDVSTFSFVSPRID